MKIEIQGARLTHVVLDLETLGTHVESPVIEIGACAIDEVTGEITHLFEARVNPAPYSYEFLLRNADEYCDGSMLGVGGGHLNSVAWWMGTEERRRTLAEIMDVSANAASPVLALNGALADFARFYWELEGLAGGNRAVRLWSNGPAFDAAMLRHNYERAGLEVPWHCTVERCVRTALELAGYARGSFGWSVDGKRHRAKNDAMDEAQKLWSTGALSDVNRVARALQNREAVK
jgi:hypothetical protein